MERKARVEIGFIQEEIIAVIQEGSEENTKLYVEAMNPIEVLKEGSPTLSSYNEVCLSRVHFGSKYCV